MKINNTITDDINFIVKSIPNYIIIIFRKFQYKQSVATVFTVSNFR